MLYTHVHTALLQHCREQCSEKRTILKTKQNVCVMQIVNQLQRQDLNWKLFDTVVVSLVELLVEPNWDRLFWTLLEKSFLRKKLPFVFGGVLATCRYITSQQDTSIEAIEDCDSSVFSLRSKHQTVNVTFWHTFTNQRTKAFHLHQNRTRRRSNPLWKRVKHQSLFWQ